MKQLVWLVLVAGCGNSSMATDDLSVAADLSSTDLAGAACASPSVKLTKVLSGLAQPTFVTAEDAHRLFVLQRGGKIRLAVDGALQPAAFLDLTAQVASMDNDDGLLGLA